MRKRQILKLQAEDIKHGLEHGNVDRTVVTRGNIDIGDNWVNTHRVVYPPKYRINILKNNKKPIDNK
jgi:hypothetical protein